MKAIELYLITENHQGLEAVDFYKDVFGAEVMAVTTYGQAIPGTLPENEDILLNAQLKIGDIRLQLSDTGLEQSYVQGNNITACLQLDSVQEATAIYQKLSQQAQAVVLELQETPWSPAYAQLVDRFGISWQINADIEGFVSEKVNF